MNEHALLSEPSINLNIGFSSLQNSSHRHLECPYPKSLLMTGHINWSKTCRGRSRRMHRILYLPSSHLGIKNKTKNSQAVTHLSAQPPKHQTSLYPRTLQNQLLGPGEGWVGQDLLWLWKKLEMNKVALWISTTMKTAHIIDISCTRE